MFRALLSGFLAAAIGAMIGFVCSYILGWLAVKLYIHLKGYPTVVYFDIFFHRVQLYFICGFAALFFLKKFRSEYRQNQWRKRAQEQLRQRRLGSLESRLQRAKDLFDTLPSLLKKSEDHLDRAEIEYSENSYILFWVEIEKAVRSLAEFYENIKEINSIAEGYNHDAKTAPASVPPMNLPLNHLPDPNRPVNRLHAIFRRAQKNFHFADIYEKRRHSQILIEGFGDLTAAIYSIAGSIDSAVSDLSDRIDPSAEKFNPSNHPRATDRQKPQKNESTGNRRRIKR